MQELYSKENFENFINNLIKRITHDIANPLTTSMNGIELLKETSISNMQNNSSRLFNTIENSINNLYDKVNLIRYLYIINENNIFPKSQVQTWKEILERIANKNEVKIQFNFNFLEEKNSFFQIITHLIYEILNYLSRNSQIIIENFNEHNTNIIQFSCIDNQEFTNYTSIENTLNFLSQNHNNQITSFNPININLHFFKFVLQKYNIKIEYTLVNKYNLIVKFFM